MSRFFTTFSTICLGATLLSAVSFVQAAPIASPTHPGAIFRDFSNSDDAKIVAPYAAPGGVVASVQIEAKDGALQFLNRAGGSFGLKFNLDPFDAETLSDLYFDYKAAPDAKINFFFKVNGKYHGAIFTGPNRVRPGSIYLGQIEGVKADSTWHRAHIPLRAWLRKLYPGDQNVRVEEVIAGNWDNEGYLLAGVGGNGPGATWSLDNFALLGAGPREAKFVVGGASFYAVDEEKKQRVSADLDLKPADGFHWLHSFDGAGKPLNSYPFLVAGPPLAGTPSWKGNVIVWPLSEGAGLDGKTLNLKLDGQSYGLSSPFLTFDGTRGELRFDAGAAGLHWDNGASLTMSLEGLRDVRGQESPPKGAGLAVDFAHHEGPLPLPIVHFEGMDAPVGNFETGVDEWATYGDPGAIIERDDQNPSAGQWSLRLTNPRSATPFGAMIRSTPFDAVKFPVLRFDYRIQERLRLDFSLMAGGKTYLLKFTDRDGPKDVPTLGQIPGIVADEKWHSAEIPLLAWLKQAGAPTTIDKLWVQDNGWFGNSRGVQWWVDNFRFVPQFADGNLAAKVELRDITGLKAVSWTLDDRPDTIPDEGAEPGKEIQTKGQGRLWLHVRAQNGAGAWSATEHVPVWLGG